MAKGKRVAQPLFDLAVIDRQRLLLLDLLVHLPGDADIQPVAQIILIRAHFQIQQAFGLHDNFPVFIAEGQPALGDAFADCLENFLDGLGVLQGFMAEVVFSWSHGLALFAVEDSYRAQRLWHRGSRY